MCTFLYLLSAFHRHNFGWTIISLMSGLKIKKLSKLLWSLWYGIMDIEYMLNSRSGE